MVEAEADVMCHQPGDERFSGIREPALNMLSKKMITPPPFNPIAGRNQGFGAAGTLTAGLSKGMLSSHEDHSSYVYLKMDSGREEGTISQKSRLPTHEPVVQLEGNYSTSEIKETYLLGGSDLSKIETYDPSFLSPATPTSFQRHVGLVAQT